MPAVHRLGDTCTGHGCFAPRANTEASSDVFVNNIGAHRVGDGWSAHGCGICPPHTGNLASGSSTVYVDGKALGRIGDSVSCGSSTAEGSSNVFAG